MKEPKKPTIHYLPLPNASLSNPFRPGTKKAQCWAIFAGHGGTRAELIERMEKTGAAGNTCVSWLSTFREYARLVRVAAKKGGTETE